MNFLAAVAGFLASIWLTGYIFVTLDNTLLGLGGIALVFLGFMYLFKAVRDGN